MNLSRNEYVAVAAALVVIIIFFVGPQIASVMFPPAGQVAEELSATAGESVAQQSVMIQDVKVGEGVEANVGDLVTVHYAGTFENGQEFDNSNKRGTPFQFRLGTGSVIKGWDQGVVGMKVGGVRKLTIPPELGYGFADYGPIPGGSTLYFEVELLGVSR